MQTINEQVTESFVPMLFIGTAALSYYAANTVSGSSATELTAPITALLFGFIYMPLSRRLRNSDFGLMNGIICGILGVFNFNVVPLAAFGISGAISDYIRRKYAESGTALIVSYILFSMGMAAVNPSLLSFVLTVITAFIAGIITKTLTNFYKERY